jgi:hypothetical protein
MIVDDGGVFGTLSLLSATKMKGSGGSGGSGASGATGRRENVSLRSSRITSTRSREDVAIAQLSRPSTVPLPTRVPPLKSAPVPTTSGSLSARYASEEQKYGDDLPSGSLSARPATSVPTRHLVSNAAAPPSIPKSLAIGSGMMVAVPRSDARSRHNQTNAPRPSLEPT